MSGSVSVPSPVRAGELQLPDTHTIAADVLLDWKRTLPAHPLHHAPTSRYARVPLGIVQPAYGRVFAHTIFRTSSARSNIIEDGDGRVSLMARVKRMPSSVASPHGNFKASHQPRGDPGGRTYNAHLQSRHESRSVLIPSAHTRQEAWVSSETSTVLDSGMSPVYAVALLVQGG